jgi:hypothetical protein
MQEPLSLHGGLKVDLDIHDAGIHFAMQCIVYMRLDRFITPTRDGGLISEI